MRAALAGIVFVSLALCASHALAQDAQPLVRMERPVAILAPATQPVTTTPTVDIGRPVALTEASSPVNAPARIDSAVKPAGFSAPGMIGFDPSGAQEFNGSNAQPLPSGPRLDSDPPPLADIPSTTVSRRLIPQPVETAPPPQKASTPTLLEPSTTDLSGGPVLGTDDACCGGSCGLFGGRGNCIDRPGSFWMSAEYLGWWTKGQNFPPLVTASPAGTSQPLAGVLGVPTTTVLLGGEALNGGILSGGRATMGYWFDNDQSIGIEGSFFMLADQSQTFSAVSDGTAIIARPFYNLTPNLTASGVFVGPPRQDAELVSYPGLLAGGVKVTSTSEFLGADLDLRWNLFRGCCWRIDLLTGFRYLMVNDGLGISEYLTEIPGAPLPGSTIMVNDSFSTKNNFYGGQLGIDMEFRRGRWSLNLMEKVAIGDTHEQLTIAGSTAITPTGGPTVVLPGGLLTQSSNIGTYSRDRFAVAPETGIKLGYQLTDHIQIFATYSFLYLSSVADPAHSISTSVNTNQLPQTIIVDGVPKTVGGNLGGGPSQPAPVFKSADFWSQGVSIGLELRF